MSQGRKGGNAARMPEFASLSESGSMASTGYALLLSGCNRHQINHAGNWPLQSPL